MREFLSLVSALALGFVVYSACAACTGRETRAVADFAEEGAAFVPGPAEAVVRVGAEHVAAAVDAYLEQHPEKTDAKLGLMDYLTIIALALGADGARKGTTAGVRRLAKRKQASAGGAP